MRTEMLMPQMGESIAEATIIRWHKNVGDTVKKDETILEISTDKVDSEIPSPESGIVTELIAPVGATVPVQSVIAIIQSEGSATTSQPQVPSQTSSSTQSSKPEVINVGAPMPAKTPLEANPPSAPSVSASSASSPHTSSQAVSLAGAHAGRVLSPLVKNIAAQHGITMDELAQIPGSGAHGRLSKDDLLHYIDSRKSFSAGKSSSTDTFTGHTPQAESIPSSAQVPARLSDGPGNIVEPFDTMRKAIAEHMVRSKKTSPHVYSVAEVDMTRVSKWREKHKNEFKNREGFNLSYMPFFLEAITKALTAYPRINATVDGESLVIKRDINLGCAVALGEDGLGGLIVPNIKNAGSLNFTGIARGLQDIASRARSKKLAPSDVQGGTFTVTNVGGFGNIIGYPIISQPQLGILALGAIKKRPVVVDDAIAVRDICYITLSYDHRVIDGALGGHFLKYITDYLQNWDMNRTL
ncbi:MAG TPA: dihydrolipoamide acetyltransferase family protein [Oligoflexia bacterium]|mgnify:CR=1 FL=1|nr:dihydrolipoamide acetyltransferase family protein [Oligoflexia bacterium]HMP48206.1 dihydrolipoamide acetyltransferase family protein [Oligoflexia bacterium]